LAVASERRAAAAPLEAEYVGDRLSLHRLLLLSQRSVQERAQ
jgi:hypothetical protein